MRRLLISRATRTRHVAQHSSSARSMSPLHAYRAVIASGELREDPHQLGALQALERLYDELRTWRPPPPPLPPPPPKESKWRGPAMDAYGEPIGGGTFYTGVKNEEDSGGLFSMVQGWWGRSSDSEDGEGREPALSIDVAAPRGVYLHGGTGCGKTMMMDQFLAPSIVPPAGAAATWVRRVHLHEFLIEMHQRTHALRQETPTMGDPVPYLAYEIGCETQVLLLDEVAVTDVADALLLRKLFRRLFNSGMIVVATSNRAPSELYLNGLQRQSFLPFIADLEQRCDVHMLHSSTDYRTLATEASGLARLAPGGLGAYLHPLNRETAADMETLWSLLTQGNECAPSSLQLAGRSLAVPMASEGAHAARFRFAEVCGQPLGPEDYLRVAKAYWTVVVTDVPQLSLNQATELRRLITMVDACYDEGVMLVVSAAVPLEELFVSDGADAHADKFGDVIGNIVQDSGDESFAMKRTLSRLQEMRSQAYVSRSTSWMRCSMVDSNEL